MKQKLDGEGRSRRSRVVGDLARPSNEALCVAGCIEKAPRLLIPEPFDHRIADLSRAINPLFVEGDLVHREKSKRDGGVVLEKSADPGDAFLVRAHDTPVPYHFPGQEFGVPDCEVPEVETPKNSGGGCDATQHQAVPRSEDLLIASGPDAFRPRFVKYFSRADENRIERFLFNVGSSRCSGTVAGDKEDV